MRITDMITQDEFASYFRQLLPTVYFYSKRIGATKENLLNLDLNVSRVIGVVDHKWIVFISVNHLILYSHRSTEKGVNSYSLRVIRGCIYMMMKIFRDEL